MTLQFTKNKATIELKFEGSNKKKKMEEDRDTNLSRKTWKEWNCFCVALRMFCNLSLLYFPYSSSEKGD